MHACANISVYKLQAVPNVPQRIASRLTTRGKPRQAILGPGMWLLKLLLEYVIKISL